MPLVKLRQKVVLPCHDTRQHYSVKSVPKKFSYLTFWVHFCFMASPILYALNSSISCWGKLLTKRHPILLATIARFMPYYLMADKAYYNQKTLPSFVALGLACSWLGYPRIQIPMP